MKGVGDDLSEFGIPAVTPPPLTSSTLSEEEKEISEGRQLIAVINALVAGGPSAVAKEKAEHEERLVAYKRDDETCKAKNLANKRVFHLKGTAARRDASSFAKMDGEVEHLGDGKSWETEGEERKRKRAEKKRKEKSGKKVMAAPVPVSRREEEEEEEEEEQSSDEEAPSKSDRDVFLEKATKKIKGEFKKQADQMVLALDEIYGRDPKKAVEVAAGFVATIKSTGSGEKNNNKKNKKKNWSIER